MTDCYFAFGSNMDKERMKKRKANFTVNYGRAVMSSEAEWMPHNTKTTFSYYYL